MYKLDKNKVKLQTFKQSKNDCLFPVSTSYGERLNEAWFLTAMAYGIDPINPPKMDKKFMGTRTHAN
jgi:hypothetical protein